MKNISSTSDTGLVGYGVDDVISLPRKRLSAFCGDYYNSTSIDVKLGVLGNECFLNGLSFVPNVIFVLVAVPVLISWNKSIFASMHVKTWVRFPHHTIRWLLLFVLIITNIFEVCTVLATFSMFIVIGLILIFDAITLFLKFWHPLQKVLTYTYKLALILSITISLSFAVFD